MGKQYRSPVFPCTYCHNDYTRTDKMLGALLDFQSGTQTSSHFIGKTFAGIPGTLGELESNWAGDSFTGSQTVLKNTNELQCVTCHDPGIIVDVAPVDGIPDDYPNHPNSTLFLTPNPYRLRGLGGVGDNASVWTPLCVGTCHVGTTLDNNTPLNPADDIAVPPMGHYGYAGYDGTTMFTPRGSALKTSNCATCHDPHSSSKANLISDGTSLPPGTPLASRGATAMKPAITESNCTLVCHIVPPNYSTAGHGKYGHSTTACTPCHTSAVSHRDSANPKRFAFDEDALPSNLPNNGLGGGSGDGLDNNYNGVLDEAGESDWRYSQESICRGCHYSYRSHSGNVNVGTQPPFHLGMAGCLDCHEPHANGIGSGPANTRMLRRTTFGETAIFANSNPPTADFYRADGNGLCDNENCHGKPLGTIAQTGTIMGDVPDHRNEGIVPGNKCTSCHTHQGTASFTADCDTCHGNPPNDVDTSPDNPDGVGVHALHVGTV